MFAVADGYCSVLSEAIDNVVAIRPLTLNEVTSPMSIFTSENAAGEELRAMMTAEITSASFIVPLM